MTTLSDTKPISLLIVDDHDMMREGLAQRLGDEPGITVQAEADNAASAIELAAQGMPDIVLMDIDMPGLSCFDAAARIQALVPQTRVIFLSAYCTDAFVEQAMAAKARGYLTKGESLESVVQAVRRVAEGGLYFSDAIRSRLVIGEDGLEIERTARQRLSRLTPRELEVLRYLTGGNTKKQTARIMHVAEKTVGKHLENLMAKLDIHDRVELTRFAIREGLTRA